PGLVRQVDRGIHRRRERLRDAIAIDVEQPESGHARLAEPMALELRLEQQARGQADVEEATGETALAVGAIDVRTQLLRGEVDAVADRPGPEPAADVRMQPGGALLGKAELDRAQVVLRRP